MSENQFAVVVDIHDILCTNVNLVGPKLCRTIGRLLQYDHVRNVAKLGCHHSGCFNNAEKKFLTVNLSLVESKGLHQLGGLFNCIGELSILSPYGGQYFLQAEVFTYMGTLDMVLWKKAIDARKEYIENRA